MEISKKRPFPDANAMETGNMMQPVLVIPRDYPKSRVDSTNESSAMELQRNAGIVKRFAWDFFFVKINPFMSYNRKTPKQI